MDPLNSASNTILLSLPIEIHGLIIDYLPFKDAFGTWKKVSKSFTKVLEASCLINVNLQKRFKYLPLHLISK
jgi:hypothetical protein